MKDMFPEYDERTQDDLDRAWRDGLLVFDTNVLLNLYRYQATTRDELIKVIGQLSQRIWVPHHVALEFQRNRLKVIAAQNRRFSEVKRTVEKARSSLLGEFEKLQLHNRHSLIDPDALTAGFSRLADEFLAELETLREQQQSLTAPDPLKATIEKLFDGRVGLPPESQVALDGLYSQAKYRYELQIPPGYEDSAKAKSDEPNEYLHRGLVYKKHFGDFLVWRQILDHAQAIEAKYVIFITDDNKEDWWRKISAEGLKVVGPRPELVDEAVLLGGVKHFLMYSPESFLKYAKEFLQAQVSDETLEEVRDVSFVATKKRTNIQEMRDMAVRAERAVYEWLSNKFLSVEHVRHGFPDFVATNGDLKFGFEVKAITNSRILFHRMKETLFRAYYAVEEGNFAELSLVMVAIDPDEVEEVRRLCIRLFREKMPSNIKIIVGTVEEYPGLDGVEFIPYDNFSWEEANNSLQRTR